MRLELRGVVETGVSLLDNGITDIKAAVVGGEVQVYSSTGRNGGIASYEINGQGMATVTSTVIFPPSITSAVDEKLVLSADGTVLYVGSNHNSLLGYRIDGDGLDRVIQSTYQTMQSQAGGGDSTATEAMVLLSEQAPAVFPTGVDCTQIVDMVSITIGGQTIVLTADSLADGVTAYQVNGHSGALQQTDTVGAAQGLGIDAPTAIDVAQVGGQSFVVVASAGSSSISVMHVTSDGSLMPTDHVVDNGSTRFAGVQDLAVAQSGDHAFVVAGGADNGLTLFMVLPNGSLVHLQTIADTGATSLHKVTAVEAVVDGDTMHVFAGSQNDDGLTQFTVDLSRLGSLQVGTNAPDALTGNWRDDILMAQGQGDVLNGRGGADVLVAGEGNTQMTGGWGADIFVFQEGSGTSRIHDFERGHDRIDLTDLPMLRDVSQLTITTTSSGAQIEYRGHVITVTAADGRPLSVADLFPNGLEGGDHFDYYPVDPNDPVVPIDLSPPVNPGQPIRPTPPPPPPAPPDDPSYSGPARPGVMPSDPLMPKINFVPSKAEVPRDKSTGLTRSGSDAADKLRGASRDDTIDGSVGNDIINGFGGHDKLFGGLGDDKLRGGAGNDSLLGGAGNDLVLGGAGADTLIGGDGNDNLFGGTGNDVLYGTAGSNRMGLGQGDDWAMGGTGNDKIYGSKGNDTVFGGAGNDSAGGGPGHDYVSGGNGNDLLFGKGGNDWITGGNGADTMWGGMAMMSSRAVAALTCCAAPAAMTACMATRGTMPSGAVMTMTGSTAALATTG